MSDEPAIKAIPTKYRGYSFRSRLEARWAVFLDTLGVRWEYETEGYKPEDQLFYLPDFYLPDLQSWLEIKGRPLQPYDDTWRKAALLAAYADDILDLGDDAPWHPHYVYVFCGQFRDPDNMTGHAFLGFEHLSAEDARNWAEKHPEDRHGFPTSCWWFQCPVCKRWQPGPSRHDLPCGCLGPMPPGDQPELWTAIERAKQARFEHGENG